MLFNARNCAACPEPGQRCHATFQCSNTLFKHIGGGVHDTGVDIPEFFQPKKIGCMCRIVEPVRSGLVNGTALDLVVGSIC